MTTAVYKPLSLLLGVLSGVLASKVQRATGTWPGETA